MARARRLFNRSTASIGCTLVLLFFDASPSYTQEIHTEDFSTDIFKDTTSTTADWNTDAEGLGLGTFQAEILGSLATSGDADKVTASGDLVAIATQSGRLVLVDVGDPASPVVLHSVTGAGQVLDVKIWGNYVCVADSPYGLKIWEISVPTNLVLLGFYDTSGTNRIRVGDRGDGPARYL